MMLPAQFAEACQGAAVPDLPGGVVGVAQDHQRGLRVGQLAFQVLPVDGVPSGRRVVGQRRLKHIAAVVEDRVEEDVVYRRLDDHVLGRRGQLAHHAGDRGDHPGAEDQRLAFEGHAVAVPPPADIGVRPLIGHDRVAEDAMVEPAAHRLPDRGRGLEIHVGHPHRQRVAGLLPFERVGAGTVGQRIEIVGHRFSCRLVRVPCHDAACRCATARRGRRAPREALSAPWSR